MKKQWSIIVALLMPCFLLGQSLLYSPFSAFTVQPVLQDSLNHAFNFYDQSHNPSALFDDERQFVLRMGSRIGYQAGDFHRQFDPKISNDQQYGVELVKPLDENNLFKGNFGYRRQIEQQIRWVHQNRRVYENPFLLGDSSTGDFIAEGIFWSAEWAHRFPGDLFTGVGLSYHVDQRLKQNFPKPENNHRDIHFSVGVQKKWGPATIGLNYRYFDEQEQVQVVRYSLDQTLTPVFYKFRYVDLPLILTGKTSEERLVETSGAIAGVQARYLFSRKLQAYLLVSRLGYAIETTDGGSSPQPQGSVDTEELQGEAGFHWLPGRKQEVRVTYRVMRREAEFFHPEFHFQTGNLVNLIHHLVLSAKIDAGNGHRLFSDVGFERQYRQKVDRMTANFFDLGWDEWSVRVGALHPLFGRFRLGWWFSNSIFRNQRNQFTRTAFTNFLNILFLSEIDYYRQLNQIRGGGISVNYSYLPVVDIHVGMNLWQLNSRGGIEFFGKRENLELKFSLNFYII